MRGPHDLTEFAEYGRRIGRKLNRPGLLPAAIALVVVVIAGVLADYQNREVHTQRLRNEMLSELGIIRAKLEGNINGNIQLLRGLVATLETEPGMNQQRFGELAGNILESGPELTHIAAAPDLVVRMVYPLKGNEKAIGLDYSHNQRQREAALKARDTGELVLAGPVRLVQGGEAFIARFPVYVHESDGKRRFWGLVSAVLDVTRLYMHSGLLEKNLPFDLAISGKDGKGARGDVFFGHQEVFDRSPVTADILLPFGSWRIAAVPKQGWTNVTGEIWLMRVLIVIAGSLVVIPIFITGRLVEERQRNIHELHARGAELARVSHRLELALETSRVGVWEMNLESGRLVWDARMMELYGLDPATDSTSYTVWSEALHTDDAARAEADFSRAVETGRYNSDFRIVLPTGRVRHLRANGAVVEDPDGGQRIVGLNWDVSTDVQLNDQLKRANALTEARNLELETAKARIEHASLHDSLTGLPNRRYLDQMLERHAEARPGSRRIALLHVDLDRFKQINDTLGHAAGDAMLVHAAAILRGNVRHGDFVARVGGDEFVILCSLPGGDGDPETVTAEMAGRIIAAMQKPVPYENHECRFGVSVGIAIEHDRSLDPRHLLIDADLALYRAKSRGKNRHQFFTDTLQAEILAVKKTADEILNGLERGEFVAYYQPQFDAHTHDVVGVEALVRWNHPTRGLLRPAAFLETAEELSVVPEIDRLILEQALGDLAAWREAGVDIGRVSVNVSARRLRDEELITGLARLPIEPGTLAFELVESIFLDEKDELLSWNVDRIKELGIDIEIDDFGTGYASIVSLQKLRPKRLKIDRQLVMPVVRSAAQRQLVHSIVEIGRSLGIEVIAEGVETSRHAQVLASLGCNALQGYAFARPMRASDIASFVRGSAWRKAS